MFKKQQRVAVFRITKNSFSFSPVKFTQHRMMSQMAAGGASVLMAFLQA